MDPLASNAQSLPEENHGTHHSYRMIFITGVVLLVLLGGVVVLRDEKLQTRVKEAFKLNTVPGNDVNRDNDTPKVKVTTISNRNEPWVEVVSAEENTQYTVGEEIVLYVKAGTGTKDISGYDVLLAIDEQMFETVSISSEKENFQIFQFAKDDHITITGIKSLQDKTATTFNDETLLKIVLKGKNPGVGVVSIYPSQGKEKTQFVDTQVTPITPQIGSLEIEVK